MSLEYISFKSFTYFSTTFKFKVVAILLVMIIILLLLNQIKSTEISNLIFLRSLLMLETCIFDCTITLSTLFVLIKIMIYFFRKIILSLNLSFWLDLLIILYISENLSTDSLENTSLILKKSLTLFLKAWVYKGLLF